MTRIITILLFLPVLTQGASADTIIYRSSFQQKVFQDIRQKRAVPDLMLFSIYDGDSLAFVRDQEILNNFYIDVLNPKLKSRDEKVRAKTIFNEVHRHFLLHYVDTANFSSVFKNTYNCVSGSALYALVLKHYGIPYEIREMPSHVYVIAFPQTHVILFESTNPRGYIDPDLRFKEYQVNKLITRNFLAKSYVDEVGTAKAYNDFFYSKNSISLQDLAGIQYLNRYIRERERKNYKTALQMLRKADVMFPTKKNDLFRFELLEYILDRSPLDSLETFSYMTEYTNGTDTQRSRDLASSLFASVMEKFLIGESDEKYIGKVYAVLTRQLTNAQLLKEIRLIFNQEYARYYGMKNKYEEAMRYAVKAFEENPDNVLIQSYIVNSILGSVGGVRPGPSTIKMLDDYALKYPFFRDNSAVRDAYVNCYAAVSYSNFLGDRPKEGHIYQQLLEKELSSLEKDRQKPETLIGYVYAEAGAYYYRMHNFKKALEVMNLGLTYAPDHPEIKARIKIVQDEIKASRKLNPTTGAGIPAGLRKE